MHIGKEIEKQLAECGITKVEFAKQLGCDRTNVYKLLKKSSLDTQMLLRISRILHTDFFALYSRHLSS